MLPTAMTRRRTIGTAAGGCAGTLAAACDAGSLNPAAKPVVQSATVRYLHYNTGQQVSQENWTRMFSSFEDKYPNVKLQADQATQSFANLTNKLIATFAGGEYYDMTYGHYSILPTFLDAGVIRPLDGFLTSDRARRPVTSSRRQPSA